MKEEEETTTVRVRKETHDILRYLAYKEDKKIIDIVDDLCAGKGPTLSEKVGRMLKGS